MRNIWYLIYDGFPFYLFVEGQYMELLVMVWWMKGFDSEKSEGPKKLVKIWYSWAYSQAS